MIFMTAHFAKLGPGGMLVPLRSHYGLRPLLRTEHEGQC